MRQWPESVERVAAVIRQAGIEARLEEFEGGTPTAQDAARAVGCELREIVKSLVFDCDGRPVVVLVPGDRRADPRKVAAAAKAGRAEIASPDQVRRVTGFEPGAVAPFPLPHTARVFVERTLLANDVVWIGAGSANHLAAIHASELVRLSNAVQMDAVEERPYHSAGPPPVA